MADMGLGMMGGAAGAADGIAQLFDQRLKAAQLSQQDALTRLKVQELADARADTITQRNQIEADRAAHQKEVEQDRADQRARTAYPLIPLHTPVSPQTMQTMTQAGIPQEAFQPTPDQEAAPPDAIAAPDQPTDATIPGTMANSPAPSMRTFERAPSPQETEQGRKRQAVEQLKGLYPIGSPQRAIIDYEDATGKNAPASLEPKVPSEDQRYDEIVTRQKQKLPVAPAESAFVQAYEQRHQIGPTASSAASDRRMDDQQLFQQQQVGRRELTDNVEKPYREAQAQASELRDIVTAAKAGNKFAGSQQALMGAIATIRSSGLNRINAAEIGAAANAGSLWDRIQGAVGKQAEGQPMSPDLQKDLLDYATLLEKAAHQKYLKGFASVTKRYKLTDETPEGGAGAAVSSGNRVRYDMNGNRIP